MLSNHQDCVACYKGVSLTLSIASKYKFKNISMIIPDMTSRELRSFINTNQMDTTVVKVIRDTELVNFFANEIGKSDFFTSFICKYNYSTHKVEKFQNAKEFSSEKMVKEFLEITP
jgi:hypothetical protein